MLGIRRRGGGGITIFCPKFFCLSTESFHRGTLLCFRSFVSVPNHFEEEPFCFKNSRIEKFYAKGGNITIFYWKSVVSEYRKNFVGETFCVSQNFWYRKTLWIRGGGGEEEGGSITILCQNFCLTVPKNFVEEPFCFSEHFWYRKMLGLREGAGITLFRQNSFVSQCRKTS